jgi:hypothetical protein
MNVLAIVGTAKKGVVSSMCQRILDGDRENGHHDGNEGSLGVCRDDVSEA